MKIHSLSLAILAATAVTSATLFTLSAQARPEEGRVHSLLYSCNMSFHASGKSIYIGIGYTDLHGEGTLSCYDLAHGVTQQIPLKVTARGPGAGLGVTGLVVSGGATGVGISSKPEALLGHYLMVRGNAAAGVGSAAGAAIRLSNGSATIDATIQAETGLGAGVDILWVNIEAADRANSDGSNAPAPLAALRPSSAPAATALSFPANAPAETPLNPSNSQAPVRAVVLPTSTVSLHDGQPIELLDANGHVTQLIYVNRQ